MSVFYELKRSLLGNEREANRDDNVVNGVPGASVYTGVHAFGLGVLVHLENDCF